MSPRIKRDARQGDGKKARGEKRLDRWSFGEPSFGKKNAEDDWREDEQGDEPQAPEDWQDEDMRRAAAPRRYGLIRARSTWEKIQIPEEERERAAEAGLYRYIGGQPHPSVQETSPQNVAPRDEPLPRPPLAPKQSAPPSMAKPPLVFSEYKPQPPAAAEPPRASAASPTAPAAPVPEEPEEDLGEAPHLMAMRLGMAKREDLPTPAPEPEEEDEEAAHMREARQRAVEAWQGRQPPMTHQTERPHEQRAEPRTPSARPEARDHHTRAKYPDAPPQYQPRETPRHEAPRRAAVHHDAGYGSNWLAVAAIVLITLLAAGGLYWLYGAPGRPQTVNAPVAAQPNPPAMTPPASTGIESAPSRAQPAPAPARDAPLIEVAP